MTGLRLIAAVYVRDPGTREEVILLPGECPEPEIAALVTNPRAWDVPPDAREPDRAPVVMGEHGPVMGKSEAEQDEADSGSKKPPPRRTRSSAG
nr:hypothetical protein OH820_15320 [Streptomyces sp. NBC_00857]